MNEITVNITKLNKYAQGVALFDDRIINVDNTLPGDIVKVIITDNTKKTIIGKLVKIIQSSPLREIPPCKFYNNCGGCNLQHLNKDLYKTHKNQILIDQLSYIGADISKVQEPIIIGPNSRRRASFKVEKKSNQIKLGFFAEHSHQIIDINYCLLLEPELNNLIEPLKNLLNNLKIEISEIYLLNSDNGIDLLLHSKAVPQINVQQQLVEFAKDYNLARISLIINNQIYPIITLKNVTLKLGEINVSLPENCFIQASRASQNYITNLIIEQLKNYNKIIDLYAGCGTYSFPLANHCKVHAVEGSKNMAQAMKAASAEKVTIECRDLYKNSISHKDLNSYQAVIINPPRNGASNQVKEIAASKIKKVIMVSCNPQTFASDAKLLLDKGFKLSQATAIDQFYYSNHLEICGIFQQ